MDYPNSVPSAGLVNGKFVDENPMTGTPGSLIPADWGNGVTQEILSVINAAGLTPDEKKIRSVAASDSVGDGQGLESGSGVAAGGIAAADGGHRRWSVDGQPGCGIHQWWQGFDCGRHLYQPRSGSREWSVGSFAHLCDVGLEQCGSVAQQPLLFTRSGLWRCADVLRAAWQHP